MAKLQFNLLPDVKVAYESARRTQSKVLYICALVSGIAVAVFLITFLSVDLGQKTLLSSADKKINSTASQIAAIPNIGKILTIQGQLNALPGLHNQKHLTSRFFGYLHQLTPSNAGINQFSLDTTASSITITGSANTVSTVNQFVDTLKFTKFTTASNSSSQDAFSSVVLSTVNRDSKSASYTITANYNSDLLMPNESISLAVPSQVTTQSVTNAPPVFTGQTSTSGVGQ